MKIELEAVEVARILQALISTKKDFRNALDAGYLKQEHQGIYLTLEVEYEELINKIRSQM